MKVLLVGGLGFIGKHVIKKLIGSFEFVVLSDPEGLRRNSSFAKALQLRVLIGDITDGTKVDQVFEAEKPEAVVHLAALTGLTRCNYNPSLAFSTNVLGTYNVVMGCIKHRCKLVFISSREVYGETKGEPTREDDPLLPNNVYGLTKLLGESLIQWAASRHGLDYTILRLTNVYGPEGDQYNIQAMIESALSQAMIPIFGGSQQMNLIYVEDVAELIRRCLIDPRTSRQTFNVGSNDDVTIEELVAQLIAAMGVPVRIERKPMRPGETVNFRPNLEKIGSLGYNAQTTLSGGLKKTITWYKDHTS